VRQTPKQVCEKLTLTNSRRKFPNSLLSRKFSLLPVKKFPVQSCREFGCKLLNLRANWKRKSPHRAKFCKIPC
jgi:hypothetical protein